mmetsp:Transcript_314/g.341  ORF Transcript_314/g.341 Transcript_314/m.341 type:complete len:293 (-) Transcript_314:27-905(-)
MSAHNGNTDAGGSNTDILSAPDLCSLLNKLHFLLVVANILKHRAVVREEVEGVLMGKNLRNGGLAVKNITSLLTKLFHGGGASTTSGLVSGNDHAVHLSNPVKRSHSHKSNDSGAVRVGNDGSLALANLDVRHSLRVDLRNDEGHTLSHTECRAVVDNDATRFGSEGAELLRNRTARTEKSNVDTVEALISELLDGIFNAVEGLLLSCRSRRGKHLNLAVREVALLENRKEFLAYGTSDTNDSDLRAIRLLRLANNCNARGRDPSLLRKIARSPESKHFYCKGIIPNYYRLV